MAGLFKRVTNFLIGAGNDDYDDEYNDDYDEDYKDDSYEKPAYADIADISPRVSRARGSVGVSTSYSRRYASNVVDIHKKAEINICTPKNIEDARDVIDNTKDGIISVVNLEGVESNVAQRIADFLSGSVDALDGNIRRLSNDMFVIAPVGVEVTGDLAADINDRLRSGGVTMPWAATSFS